MTLLLSWVGIDSRKIASVYIASDSRFSWGNSENFDYGQKVFSFDKTPDILGYCGDVLYPTFILNQILNMAQEEILFGANLNRYKRSEIIFDELKKKFDEYPSKALDQSIEIIHISRDNEIDFLCNIFTWNKKNGWKKEEKEIPNVSDKIIILGSGADEYFEKYKEYYRGNNGKTSRAIFQSLCHTLFKMENQKCGGAPQLVGLYNKFNGKRFGIIFEERRFFLGKEIENSEIINNIEWRNELFERSDGRSLKILDGAQKQPNELRP